LVRWPLDDPAINL